LSEKRLPEQRFGKRPPVTPAWKAAAHLVCVRLDTMGDVLMAGPAMRALREAVPGRTITLITSRAGAAVAGLMPEVDQTWVWDAPWMKPAPGGSLAEMRARLREARPDAAVIFTTYTQSPLPAAVVLQEAGVPLRTAHCRENPYALLTDWVPEREPEVEVRHEVRRQLDLAAAVGATTTDERLRVSVSGDARRRVGALLGRAGLGEGVPWALVHPGATAESRRYPLELWAEACRELARDHGVALAFSGDEGERPLSDALREAAGEPGPSFAGELGLPELAALVEAAPVLLAGNTGPVHLAAAVGTPVVDIYALTNPQHTPWRVPSRVLYRDVPCRWCYRSVCPEGHHLCVRGVEPREVVAATLGLLRGEEPPPLSLPPVPARTPLPRGPRRASPGS
jgi:ADP-heptose:LPS heptosyltransferase